MYSDDLYESSKDFYDENGIFCLKSIMLNMKSSSRLLKSYSCGCSLSVFDFEIYDKELYYYYYDLYTNIY